MKGRMLGMKGIEGVKGIELSCEVNLVCNKAQCWLNGRGKNNEHPSDWKHGAFIDSGELADSK